MLEKIIGKIPVKSHKKIVEGLFILAFFTAGFSLLGFLNFAEVERTTGILWWAKTTEKELTERLLSLLAGIVFILVTTVSIIAAIKLYSMSGRFKKYLPVIKGCDQFAIQQIAAIMNLTSHQVINDLQNMIDSGYIKGYYINYQRQMLVERGDLPRNIMKKVVQCPHCGADTLITIGIVNYCQCCKRFIPDEM